MTGPRSVTTAGVLRRLDPADRAGRDRLLALNAAHEHLTGPLDDARLDRLLGWSADAWLIEHEGEVAGFVLTLPAGTGYDSPNYLAHSERFDRFTYLDRIVIDPAHRRRGLASAAYAAVEAAAAPTGRLALEVNLLPPNEPSLAFHRNRGFRPVGELDAGPGKRVLLMVRDL